MLIRKTRHALQLSSSTVRAFGKPKIFGIGRNKTGTTSLAKALAEVGIPVGREYYGDLLIHDWARRDFRRLFLFCHTAQAFQDVPFSWPDTYRALDQHFRGSKFILTLRDTPDQWYRSLMRFYATIFGNGESFTLDDLRRSTMVYPGWAYEANRMMSNTPESDPFNKELLIASYNAHNAAVSNYFGDRPNDLLVLNVSEPDAYNRLCDFLGKPRTEKSFPWENRTSTR